MPSGYVCVFVGDTRIIVIRVNPLDNEIPKPLLLERLEKEADSFIYTITHFDLPDSTGRLRVPVITTEEKRAEQVANTSSLQEFIEEKEKEFEDFWKALSIAEKVTRDIELSKEAKEEVKREIVFRITEAIDFGKEEVLKEHKHSKDLSYCGFCKKRVDV